VILVAGFVQGAVGFGSGLVAVGLLGAIYDIKSGAVVFCVPALIQCLVMLARLRRHFTLRRVWPVFIGVAVGVPLGVRFFVASEAVWLEILLAGLMLATVIYKLVPHFSKRRWHPIYVGAPIGVFGGVLGGVLSTPGPPVVAYVSTQRFDRLRFAACLQGLFVASTGLRVIELVRTGVLTKDLFVISAAGAAPVVVGSLLGMWVLHRVSEKVFQRLVIVMLGLLGAWYLGRAVVGAWG